MSIFFLLSHVERPAGGHSVILDHVLSLRENGIDAYIFFKESSGPSYYRSLVPQEAIANFSPFEESTHILVIPEADLILWASRIIAHRPDNLQNIVILNQNHFYTFNHGDDHASWIVFRGARHMATSVSIQRFLMRLFPSANIPLVRVPIRTELFRPSEKILQISYMPRKMPEFASFIRQGFCEMFSSLNNVPWVTIENMSPEEVAAVLNHSAIFLSLARQEGFGMPALEAMSAGCIVVGFTGIGGDEYATNQNGLWVEENGFVDVISELGEAVNDFLTQEPYIQNITRSARATAKNYDKGSFEKSLLDAWRNWQI